MKIPKALFISVSIHLGLLSLLVMRSTPVSQGRGPIEVSASRNWNGSERAVREIEKQASLPAQGTRPVIGKNSTSPGNGENYSAYLAGIRNQIESAVIYPRSLSARRVSGRVLLKLVLHKTGQLDSAGISQSSGEPELDEIALGAVSAAAPFPPAPENSGPEKLTLHLPIEFRN